MKVICRDRQKATAPEGRALSSVAADINRLLTPKTYEQLETLEVQVRKKLDSNEPIDTDYWEELLRSLTVWKARAKVKKVHRAVIDERVRGLRKQQYEEAESIRTKLAPLAPVIQTYQERPQQLCEKEIRDLDPEPLLQIRPEDKGLEILDEGAFLNQVVSFPCSYVCGPSLLLTTLEGTRATKDSKDGLCSPSSAADGETLCSFRKPVNEHFCCYSIHPLLIDYQRGFLASDESSLRERTC
jgi:hypothetical protein